MSGTHLRFINVLILILSAILGLTGLYGLIWSFSTLLFDLHRIAGWALILIIPWKTAIALRSLGRRWNGHFDRRVMLAVSVLLAIETVTILVLALLWKWQIGPYYVWLGPVAYSAIGWHWGIALGLTPLFLLHVWWRWPRPKRQDLLSRRQAVKLLGLGVATAASWGIAGTLAKSLERSGAERRFTGSREDGSFTGLDFPITNGADQGKIQLDPQTWTLALYGIVQNPLVLKYSELIPLSTEELTATLDCTGGWYSTQVWRGVRLTRLLEQAKVLEEKFHVVLRDVSGYTAHFVSTEIAEILLATHVGDQTLNHWHGYPLRAVVPSRRGGHWVKWLTEIEIVKAQGLY